MAHLAFVEQGMVKDEGCAREIAVQREERRDQPGGMTQAGKGDMRLKGTRFGIDADTREELVDLAVECRNRFLWLDAGPDGVRATPAFEHSDPGKARGDGGRVQAAERRGDILGTVAVDLADEAQRQVKLVVALPAGGGNAVHRGDELSADRSRRPQRDEEAVGRHGRASIGALRRSKTAKRG